MSLSTIDILEQIVAATDANGNIPTRSYDKLFSQLPKDVAEQVSKVVKREVGFVIATADYADLEDRVIANLSKDENKISVFTEHIDGHSLGATYYFKEEVIKLVGDYTDHKKAARKLKALVDEGNKEASSIRQKGKPITFGLSYGAYPAKVANTIGCSLEEATIIFEAYHNEMYPDITTFRGEILDVAKEQGYTHLGLGCRLYTSDPDKEVRTLFNANSQFWSILSLLAINKMSTLIEEAGYTEDIKCISTIYDSVYYLVKKDSKILKWFNDNLIEVMTKDFLKDQIVHNEAELEIGLNWSKLHSVGNKATVEEIEEILKDL
jgi:hypothetical protein